MKTQPHRRRVEHAELVGSHSLSFRRSSLPEGSIDKSMQRKEYVCSWDNCGRVLSTKWSLYRHRFVHKPCQKPMICDHLGCGKAFIDQTLLARHQLCHSQERRFRCHFGGCKKMFKEKWLLKQHRSLHLNPATFACSEGFCTKIFSNSSSMTIHKKINHGMSHSDTPLQMVLRTVSMC